MENEFLMKICITGSNTDLNYELSALMADHIDDKQNLLTLGVVIGTRKVEIRNNAIKLILVNNTGQEFFGKPRPSYYRGASACVILFEKSNLESFNVAEERYYEFRKHIPHPSISITSITSIPITLVGVIGESEEITTEQGQSLAEKLGIEYVETPVHDHKTVESIFYNLVQQVLDSKKSSEE